MFANDRTRQIIFAICAIAWVVIVLRAILNVKEPEDFVVTVTTEEVTAFARGTLSDLQARSFAEDVELCGFIFEDSEGELHASRIVEGKRASCNISCFDEPGMAPVAGFHTHGSFSARFDSEVPSTLDLESDIASQLDGYVSTPGGRFWRVDWREEQVELVCGPKCLPQDPNYRPCPGFPPERGYTRDTLRERFEDDTSMC